MVKRFWQDYTAAGRIDFNSIMRVIMTYNATIERKINAIANLESILHRQIINSFSIISN